MLERVISGGQTGADQAGLRAAHVAGITTGGTAPKGWLTEDGPCPSLADFGLVECSEPGYPARTRANVLDADATIWFGSIDSKGFHSTHDAAVQLGRPFFTVYQGITTPSDVAEWIRGERSVILNVAGNRESINPGIGGRVERFLTTVFLLLARSRG